MRRFHRTILIIVILATAAAAAAAADPGKEIRDLEDGRLGFRYPARDGVEGNDDHFRIRLVNGDRGNDSIYARGLWCDDDDLWTGDVHALLKVRDGRIRDIEFTVLRDGDAGPRVDRDLGGISAAGAAAFFLDVARTADADVAEDAVMGAVVAQGVRPAHELAAIVRERSLATDVRESALFWMAVLAAKEAMSTARNLIDDEDEDMDLRSSALFALTQLEEDRAFPLLLDVARKHPNHELRAEAFIWLAEYDRPEVVNLFEDILVSK